jgi:outer membrane protein assembly factor BamB
LQKVCSIFAIVIAAFLASPIAGLACGSERWSIKVGADSDSLFVLGPATDSTISALSSLLAPSRLSPSSRLRPVETSVYRLSNVRLQRIDLQSDLDYRLTISDDSGLTMFAKSPDPRCATDSKFFIAIQNVHQQIGNLALSAASGQRITITGIGFFDFLSPERGQAPNGVELHPLLSICAGINCANAPPKSGAPPVSNPFPIGSSPAPKSKRSPTPAHGIANGATPDGSPDDPAVVSYESVIQGEGASQFAELDETAGTTASIDFTSSIGTYVGADVLNYAAGPIVGSTANSVRIPGGTASIGVAMPSAAWVAGNSFTIETWVKPTAQSNYMTIWGADSSRRLLISSTRKLLSQFGGVNFTSTNALINNAWSLVDYAYNATTGQASYYINGVLDSTSPTIATSTEHMTTYYLGQYDTSANYKYVGQIADVALYPSALSGSQIAANYGAAVAATPGVDWNTFGFDLYRTGYNPSESIIGVGNVGRLHPLWRSSASVGGNMVGEPVLATSVMINHIPTNVLYAGGASGTALYAINADTGATIWTHPMGVSTRMCSGRPAVNYATLDTGTIDRATNRIYIADGQDQLHALDLATGAEAGGWPVTVNADPIHNAVWAGLTYNPANSLIYVETASEGCDVVPWEGSIEAINTSTATIVGTFLPAQGNNGGGVWGYGGASIDPATNNVFIATGNSNGIDQTLGYSEQIVELSPDVSTVLAANYPGLPALGDSDFGATPLLFNPPGCPPLLAAVNKSGIFALYNRGNITAGPIQTIGMSIVVGVGDFIGVPAYDPTTNYVYVGLPSTFGIYNPGLGAFSIQADCTLNPTPVWNAFFGPDGAANPNSPVPRSALTIANGVVYVSNFSGKTEYAFDATTGGQLWSTTLIGNGVPGAIVANGHLYVSDNGGNIMEWGP